MKSFFVLQYQIGLILFLKMVCNVLKWISYFALATGEVACENVCSSEFDFVSARGPCKET